MSVHLCPDSLRKGLLSYAHPINHSTNDLENHVTTCISYLNSCFDKEAPLLLFCQDGYHLVVGLLSGLLGGYTVVPVDASSPEGLLKRVFDQTAAQAIITDVELRSEVILRGPAAPFQWPEKMRINPVPYLFPKVWPRELEFYKLTADALQQYGNDLKMLAEWQDDTSVACVYNGDVVDLIRQLIPVLMFPVNAKIFPVAESGVTGQFIDRLFGTSCLFAGQELILDLIGFAGRGERTMELSRIITFNNPNKFFYTRCVTDFYQSNPSFSGFLNLFGDVDTSLAFSYTRHNRDRDAFNLDNLNLGVPFSGSNMSVVNAAGRQAPSLVVGNLRLPIEQPAGIRDSVYSFPEVLSADWKARRLFNGTIELTQDNNRLGLSGGRMLDLFKLEHFLNEHDDTRKALVVQDMSLSGHFITKIFVALRPGTTLAGLEKYIHDHIPAVSSSGWQVFQTANIIPDQSGNIDRKAWKDLRVIDKYIVEEIKMDISKQEHVSAVYAQVKVEREKEGRLHINRYSRSFNGRSSCL